MNPEVQDAITRAAQEEGVDPAFALAVASRESNFDPDAHASRSMYGLFQMSGALRAQYGGSSNDAYDQTKAWARFINDTKAGLAQRIGREPTNDELYLAHYFGEGRAARMIGGGIPSSTSVADVFAPAELAANPNIGRAGTVGNLTSSIGADMERRQAKYGGNYANPMQGTPDFASFGDGAGPVKTGANYSNSIPDFASFGQPQGGLTYKSTSQPIDFAQFGQQESELQGPGGNPQQGGSGPLDAKSEPPAAAQGAGDLGNLPLDMTSAMARTKFDPGTHASSNVEDDRNTSPLGKLANKFSAQVGGTWENPDTAGQEVDVSQFGLPDTAAAAAAIAPPAAPLPDVPVTGL
jgi:hypothetical protein